MAGDQFVFISSPLDFSSFICLMFSSCKSADPATSDFSLTTMRCRQLLFQFPSQLLACPRTEENAVLVVCPSSLADSPQLAGKCEKLKLVSNSRFPLSPALFEECLLYTVKAKLAPSWNRVGEWLIAGRQFLHQAGHLPAVKLRLHIANSRIEVTVQATLVRWPLLQPDDLGIEIGVLEQFILGNEQCLTQENFGRRSVLVLPRLTNAFLLSVTKQLPQGCRFGEWSGIKRYWKNMYGYRLGPDDSSEPTVYYNVCFGSGQPLTYPEWTVRGCHPQPVPRSDPRPVVSDFLKQLSASMPSICGQRFVLLDQASVPLVAAVPSRAATTGHPCLKAGYPTPVAPTRSQVLVAKSHSSDWSGREDDSGYETAGQATPRMSSSVEISPLAVSANGDTEIPVPESAAHAPMKPSFGRVHLPLSVMQPHQVEQVNQPNLPALVTSKAGKPQFRTNDPSAGGDCLPTTSHNDKPVGEGKTVPSFRAVLPRPTFLSRLVAARQPLLNSSTKSNCRQLPGFNSMPSPVLLRPPCPPSPRASPSTPATSQGSKKRPVIQNVDLADLVRKGGATGLSKVNTATLLDHLRGKGVAEAKAKSKKEELVQMVVRLYQ